jgi:hypothetical protein
MAHHAARLGGAPAPTMKAALSDPLAQDGVSCTVCHKIEATGSESPPTVERASPDRSRPGDLRNRSRTRRSGPNWQDAQRLRGRSRACKSARRRTAPPATR